MDDDADSRDALAILLRWSGYEVCVAQNGEEALRAAEAHLPDLIFLDIAVPGQDGYEICRLLRETPPLSEARIVAVSGFSGKLHEARCAKAGFTAQLTKPIDPEMLGQLS